MKRTNNASWLRLMAGAAALTLTMAACGSEEETPEGGGDPSESASATESESSGGAALTNDECAASATSADSFKVGGILPLTGTLASLGPPEIAGVGLAVSDINAAGGVNGADACHQILDSGDSNDLSIVQASAQELISGTPSVVIGAASSSVSEAVIDNFTDNQITQVSPANTAVTLGGVSDFYFRTAPPDSVQGSALGTLITTDGYTRVGFLVFNDTYGTGLRDAVQETIEGAGAECVYGCQGDGDEFPPGQRRFSTDVQAVTAANPDAIVILAFEETENIVPELASSGFDMSRVYFTDGNLTDYSEEFEPGTLTNAQGTLPGNDPDQGFKDNASSWHEQFQGEPLADYSYSAESYDATILAALAAAKGGSNESTAVQENYAAVSGATDGTECTSYAECLELIEAGDEIRYAGPSGIGPIDDENDPGSAFIGIYQYAEDNTYSLTTTVEGQKG